MKKHVLAFLILNLSLVVFLVSSCKKQASVSENLMDSIDYEKKTPEWIKGSNIYEVDISKFTPEGTVSTFQQQLPQLRKMGVDLICLKSVLAVSEVNRKDTISQLVSDFRKINPLLGNEKDFTGLIDEIHKQGMHVIIDWDAHHTSVDNMWISEHPNWFKKDSPDHTKIAELNYADPELRKAVIDAMTFWLKRTDIDGFRCLNADKIPLNFWLHTRKAIDEAKPDCVLLTESVEQQLFCAFDIMYDWSMNDLQNEIAAGRKYVNTLVRLFENESRKMSRNDILMHFTVNPGQPSRLGVEEKYANDAALEAFTVLNNTIPGIPFSVAFQTEKFAVQKTDSQNSKVEKQIELATKLNELRKGNSAMWSTNYRSGFLGIKNTNPTNILSFVRHKKRIQVLCVFNFSGEEQTFELLDLFPANFNHYLGETIITNSKAENKLKPWGYSIMVAMK